MTLHLASSDNGVCDDDKYCYYKYDQLDLDLKCTDDIQIPEIETRNENPNCAKTGHWYSDAV